MPLRALRLVSRERYIRQWGAGLCSVMRGVPVMDATALLDAVADDLLASARPEVRECLEWHRREGHVTALVSGAFAPLLRVIADRMGVPWRLGRDWSRRTGGSRAAAQARS